MKKRILAVLCTVLLLISMAMTAVAATTTASAPKLLATNIPKAFPVVKQDKTYTVVDFWHALTGKYGIALQNIANWYNATEGKKDKVYVKSIFQGSYDDITIKIQATLQANNINSFPDLVQLSAQGAFSVKESEHVVYMEDLMAADPTFKIKDKLYKGALWSVTYKGKQLGMPLANSMDTMFYNASAFKAVGLDPQKPPRTIAEYAQVAAKLVIKKPGATKPTRYGAANKLDAYPLSTWIPRQKGGNSFMFDMEDGHQGTPTKFVCAEEGTLKAALTEWKKVLDTGVVDYNTVNPRANFAQGLNAMYMYSSAGYDSNITDMAAFKDKSRTFEVGVSRIPSVNADDSIGTGVSGSSVYMLDKGSTAKKNATWKFVKFMCGVDVSAYWFVSSGYYPLNMDAINTKYVQDDLNKYSSKRNLFVLRDESVKYYKYQEAWIPSSARLSSTIGDQTALIAQGKQTVDQAVAVISKTADNLLRTYRDSNK